jgi:hypothetical protein
MTTPTGRPGQAAGLKLSACVKVPEQQIDDPLGRVILQTSEAIGKPNLWVDVIELGGLDQGADSGHR